MPQNLMVAFVLSLSYKSAAILWADVPFTLLVHTGIEFHPGVKSFVPWPTCLCHRSNRTDAAQKTMHNFLTCAMF